MATIDDAAERRRKKQALRLVEHAAQKQDEAARKTAAAIRYAATEHGASLRELADAAGVSHMTVKRILERHEGELSEE